MQVWWTPKWLLAWSWWWTCHPSIHPSIWCLISMVVHDGSSKKFSIILTLVVVVGCCFVSGAKIAPEILRIIYVHRGGERASKTIIVYKPLFTCERHEPLHSRPNLIKNGFAKTCFFVTCTTWICIYSFLIFINHFFLINARKRVFKVLK